MKDKTRAQTSLEFLILAGFVMLAFAVFFMLIQDNMNVRIEERRNLRIQEIGLMVKTEIDLATQASDGYERNFSLPFDAYGEDYLISLNESVVRVGTEDNKHHVAYGVQEVTGPLIQFDNVITKENGVVKLNGG